MKKNKKGAKTRRKSMIIERKGAGKYVYYILRVMQEEKEEKTS